MLLGAGCATAGAPRGAGEGTGAVTVGQPFPDLELRDLAGDAIKVSSYRGKVVLIDLWASWCEPCKKELPVLDDLQARLRDQGVEILAVSIDEVRRNAERFVESRPRWSVRFFHDPEGTVPETLQPPRMPTSYVVDRAGVLREVNLGFEPGDAPRLEATLRNLASAP
jgi:cytochrome c biogenesis protein CcmG/thiol:disulfide interchange protein DsbE